MGALCLAGVVLNIATYRFTVYYLGLPLYMDTVFTVAVTFVCGLFWGALCGALHNIVYQTLWWTGWEPYIYALCNIATALITWLFMRFFPGELRLAAGEGIAAPPLTPRSSRLNMVLNRVIVLTLFSFALCLAMSVLGGIITAFILWINPSQTAEKVLWGVLADTMFGDKVPLLPAEILARIPVNIIDRLVAAFGGYGVAVLFRKAASGIKAA